MKILLSRTFQLSVLAALALAFPPGEVSARPAGSMEDFVHQFTSDENGVSRFYDLAWSEARYDRLGRVYEDWRQRLKAVDFDGLDQQGRIDYLLMRNNLNMEVAHLALDRRWLKEMDPLLPFRKTVQELDLARRVMKPVKSKADAEALAALPDQIKKLRARIEKAKSEKIAEKTKPAPVGAASEVMTRNPNRRMRHR